MSSGGTPAATTAAEDFLAPQCKWEAIFTTHRRFFEGMVAVPFYAFRRKDRNLWRVVESVVDVVNPADPDTHTDERRFGDASLCDSQPTEIKVTPDGKVGFFLQSTWRVPFVDARHGVAVLCHSRGFEIPEPACHVVARDSARFGNSQVDRTAVMKALEVIKQQPEYKKGERLEPVVGSVFANSVLGVDIGTA